MANDKIVVLTKDNFEMEVVKAEELVMIDFWASWCGPCRAVAPIMDELASEFDGKVKICKVNVDEESELAQRYRVMSIPTIILFKSGQMADKIIGSRSKDEFAKLLDNNL